MLGLLYSCSSEIDNKFLYVIILIRYFEYKHICLSLHKGKIGYHCQHFYILSFLEPTIFFILRNAFLFAALSTLATLSSQLAHWRSESEKKRQTNLLALRGIQHAKIFSKEEENEIDVEMTVATVSNQQVNILNFQLEFIKEIM